MLLPSSGEGLMFIDTNECENVYGCMAPESDMNRKIGLVEYGYQSVSDT